MASFAAGSPSAATASGRGGGGMCSRPKAGGSSAEATGCGSSTVTRRGGGGMCSGPVSGGSAQAEACAGWKGSGGAGSAQAGSAGMAGESGDANGSGGGVRRTSAPSRASASRNPSPMPATKPTPANSREFGGNERVFGGAAAVMIFVRVAATSWMAPVSRERCTNNS